MKIEKPNVKVLIYLLLTVLVFAMSFSITFAFNESEFSGGNVSIGDGGQLFVKNLLTTVQWIGYAIAVGWLMYLGIKYIMASADEKANLKNGMIKYVIGAILIVGAATIFGWIANSGIVSGSKETSVSVSKPAQKSQSSTVSQAEK